MFKQIIILLLLICFMFQVREVFFKFIKQQTTLVSNRETLTSSKLPAIRYEYSMH